MYLLCLGAVHNSEEVEMVVRGMLQKQWLANLRNTVHGRSRHGVVAARLTTEWSGTVRPL